jgi:hypothetical protein
MSVAHRQLGESALPTAVEGHSSEVVSDLEGKELGTET